MITAVQVVVWYQACTARSDLLMLKRRLFSAFLGAAAEPQQRMS
jgi:hypothetical protein